MRQRLMHRGVELYRLRLDDTSNVVHGIPYQRSHFGHSIQRCKQYFLYFHAYLSHADINIVFIIFVKVIVNLTAIIHYKIRWSTTWEVKRGYISNRCNILHLRAGPLLTETLTKCVPCKHFDRYLSLKPVYTFPGIPHIQLCPWSSRWQQTTIN